MHEKNQVETEVSVDQTQINKFKSLCSPERFSFLGLGFQLYMANFSGVNFTNATNMASTEGDTANITVPQKAQWYHHCDHLSLHSCAQRAGDNGREKKTTTPDQQQHLAGLFSGDWRINWSHSAAIVYPVETVSGSSY